MSRHPNPTDPTRPEPPPNWFPLVAVTLGLLTLALGLLIVGPAILFGVLGVWRARQTGDGKLASLIGIGLASAGAFLRIAVWPVWSDFRPESADRDTQDCGMGKCAL